MITIEPDRTYWESAFPRRGNRAAFTLDARAKSFREQLGLPTDRPIVMSGHQATFWHPGIAAKYLATHAAAEAFGAHPAWLVVDQDAHDPFEVRYPVLEQTPDGGSRLRVKNWRADGASAVEWAVKFEHVPTSRVPAVMPVALPGDVDVAPARGVAGGMRRIHEALVQAAGAPSAAAQVARATCTLLDPLAPGVQTLFATALARTELFGWIVDQMRADPERCRRTYKDAVTAHPDAGIAPLAVDELPLWLLSPAVGSKRQRVNVGYLKSAPVEQLAPRALLMTALLRLAGCELFIHGMGGAGTDGSSGYDAVTQQWIGEWLGLSLSPMALVTATQHLRFTMSQAPITPGQVVRAEWKAHTARHNPVFSNDPAAAEQKQALLRELEPLVGKRQETAQDRRTRRIEALTIYKRLHAVLEETRTQHASELAELDAEARAAAARRAEAQILTDRTWAFALYEDDQMRALKDAVDAWFE